MRTNSDEQPDNSNEQPDKNPTIHNSVAEAVKAEIDRQGLSFYRVAKETGISSAALSRFRKPGGTLKAESFFVLFDYLGIDLIANGGSKATLFQASGRPAPDSPLRGPTTTASQTQTR